MARDKTVADCLLMLATVLQDKKINDEFIRIYQATLADLPDQVLVDTARTCLKECRFFPTVAEIRERAEPVLQAFNLANRALIEERKFARCAEVVTWTAQNYPVCSLEGTPGACEFAGTGRCGKWNLERGG